MKKGILFLLFLSGALAAFSQDSVSVSKKFNYFFTINTGFLGGERLKSLTYSANTVHGVTIGKRLRIGAGIGIDSYSEAQTMPIIGQVSFDLISFANGNAVFLQANYGWAHAWTPLQQDYFSYSTSGGKTHGIMMGYRLSVGNLKISFASGYKFQATRSSYDSPFVIWQSAYYSPYSQVIDHNYERFTVMLGVGWH